MGKIIFITVHIDKALYTKCILNNFFILNSPLCTVVGFDNKNDNKNISTRYNQFLDSYDFTSPAWFIFCHSDWEVREDIVSVSHTLDKKCIYGPIGAFLLCNSDGSFVREYRGQCFEKKRDGTMERQQLCQRIDTGILVDTLDCQCLIVHSSLIQQYNLRFDDDLRFDLYVEDFCINAKTAHGISSKIVNIQCCHWNQLDTIDQRPQYFEDLIIVNKKYQDALFAGVVTLLGGKSKEIGECCTNEVPDMIYSAPEAAVRGTIYHVSVDPNNRNDAKTLLYHYVSPDSTVLDIGCACGDLGITLKKHKACTLYGLEYNTESVIVAQGTGVYEIVHQVDLNAIGDAEYPEYDGIFDYIILGDVLEHVYDPQDVLHKILRYLKPRGRLLISLPNIAHISIKANLLLNDFSYTDVGLLDKTHIRFFTHKSIPSFLAANRLVVEQFDYTVWDILGFQSENPYPSLPLAVKRFLLRDPHSFVSQYVMQVAVKPELSFAACESANGVIHTIDERKNPLLDQYRRNAFTIRSRIKSLRDLFVKSLIVVCLLPAAFIYAGNTRGWLQGIRKGKTFFVNVVNSRYAIEKKIENRNRLLRIIVRRSLSAAMTLKSTNSLCATLRKVKTFFLHKFGFMNGQKRLEEHAIYMAHILRMESQTEENLAALSTTIASWKSSPFLTLHMHIADNAMADVGQTIYSIEKQIYPHWELWLTVAPHMHEALRASLKKLLKDERLHIVVQADNESTMSENIALNAARGKFFMLLHNGDLLSPYALYYIAKEITKCPQARLIYSDTDVISNGVRHSPFFKPDWNEELFLNQDYLCQLTAYNTSILQKEGGFRSEYIPCHAYDAALRLAAGGTENTIRHIPRTLYHYAHNEFCLFSEARRKTGRQAVQAYLKTKGIAAAVTSTAEGLNRVTYEVQTPVPLVSCIIGMRDKAAMTRTCIDGVLQKTDYENIEIILVDNGSTEPESVALFTDLQKEKRVRIIHWDQPFNYSQIQNMAVNEAKGVFIVLLNNDIEIVDSEWLREMVGHAQKEHVGAVGARLLFANDCLQHAGVILGPNEGVGHAFRDMSKDIPLQKYLAHATRWITAVTGACLVVSKEKYIAVDGLNENDLPIGYNDVDFCIRLHLAGYHNIYTPYATLYHHESASRGKNTDQQNAEHEKELPYFIKQHSALLNADPQYNPNLSFYGTNYDVLRKTENLRLHTGFN